MLLRSPSSVATTGEEQPLKKKKASLVLPQTTISSLPDDLLLNCLARVSRLYYPILSLVSKTFRSLIASPLLYEVRSFLGCTESCLYICIRFHPKSEPRWYTLCPKPISKRKKKLSGGYVLSKIPILDSPQASWKGVVAIGSNIYNIGGTTYKEYSSSVSVLDCKSNTWRREAPRMRVERNFAIAHVIDEKIYVSGGCKDYDSSNWMEVFDPKTQTWKLLSSLPLTGGYLSSRPEKCAVVEGEIYMFGDESAVYKPKKDKWEVIERNSQLDLGWVWLSYRVIDKILYCYSREGRIKWYDSNVGDWVNLKGLKGMPKIAKRSCVLFVDYGGKMALLWDKSFPSSGYENRKISCAVIALEKRNNGDIWGNVEWLDDVLTVPISYDFVSAVSPIV